MSVDCAAVRTRLAALLRTEVDAAQEVLDEEPGDLGAASPLLVVSRRGRGRDRLTLRGGQTRVMLWLDVYVAASDGGAEYLPADVASVLDTLAQQIDTCIDAHQTDSIAGWEAIAYDADSAIEFGMFNGDGTPRFRERVGLTLTLFA